MSPGPAPRTDVVHLFTSYLATGPTVEVRLACRRTGPPMAVDRYPLDPTAVTAWASLATCPECHATLNPRKAAA